VLDEYILAKLKLYIEKIDQYLSEFNTQDAYDVIVKFFDILNNWYIRRSRSRFWQSEINDDKIAAYDTLYTVLMNMCKAMSSLLPLISEHIYLNLQTQEGDKESVHLQLFPNLDKISVDYELVQIMDGVRDICSSALSIRNNSNIRIRQPLSSLTIITEDAVKYDPFVNLIKDELNVKNVSYDHDISKYADVKLSINFPLVGKRLSGKVKQIISDSKNGAWSINGEKLMIASEELNKEEYNFTLQPKASSNNILALGGSKGLVMLDTNLSEDLIDEGVARDFIRAVQQARKEANFLITDKVLLKIDVAGMKNEKLGLILQKYQSFIEEQTLSLLFSDFTDVDFAQNITLDFDGKDEAPVRISMKVNS
jgi:isoleucyl-tRNA synthetase